MIEGKLYKLNSSQSDDAKIILQKENYEVISDEQIIYADSINTLDIPQRLGSTPRRILLGNGQIFVTKENDLVDKLINKRRSKSLLFKLESNIALVLISLVITIAVAFSFFKWGVPYTSKKLAYAMPLELNKLISDNSLKALDKFMFNPSKLDLDKKEEILRSFEKDILPFIKKEDGFKYKIHFKEWKIAETDIPNALALPNGDIVLTDEFVKLSKNKDEINSVILHEIGHIKHKHSLQRLVEGTFITVVMMFITGDASVFSDMGIGLGSVLVDSHYSREHESQADEYAFKMMLKLKIDPKNFVSILSRITDDENVNEKDEEFLNYISSHPNTKVRIKNALRYSECFKMGKDKCN